jgi:NADPH-dependent 7-cyano-7-deazaguanine reductase QueF-like protein
MPIRSVKPLSDRGTLKQVLNGESYEPPTAEELRLKQLYEHSQATHDEKLQEALGFIVMPQAGDKSAFPITVYRHREYINSLSKKIADKIEKTRQELAACFSSEVKAPIHMRMAQLKRATTTQTILSQGELIIKVASANVSVKPKRSFKRVI